MKGEGSMRAFRGKVARQGAIEEAAHLADNPVQRPKSLGRRMAAYGGALAIAAAGLTALTVTSASAAPTNTTFAAWVSLNSSIAAIVQSSDASIAPNPVTQGQNYTLSAAGGSQVIPTSNNGVPVISATNNNNMYAIPANATYVSSTPGTFTFTPTSGPVITGAVTVTYCNPLAPPLPAACTGDAASTTFLSSYAASPYLEVGTGTAVFTAGGSLVQTGWTATFTATGTGTVNQTWDEFQTTATLNFGVPVPAAVAGYPVASTYAGCSSSCTTSLLPPLVPSVIASTTIGAGLTSQTVSFTSTAPTSATVGGATYTPTATATSGLPVAITVDSTSTSVCSITGGAVSFTGAGTCTLDANQAGDGTYSPAPQVQQSITVTTTVPPVCTHKCHGHHHNHRHGHGHGHGKGRG